MNIDLRSSALYRFSCLLDETLNEVQPQGDIVVGGMLLTHTITHSLICILNLGRSSCFMEFTKYWLPQITSMFSVLTNTSPQEVPFFLTPVHAKKGTKVTEISVLFNLHFSMLMLYF